MDRVQFLRACATNLVALLDHRVDDYVRQEIECIAADLRRVAKDIDDELCEMEAEQARAEAWGDDG
jgi:hypothetical protein